MFGGGGKHTYSSVFVNKVHKSMFSDFALNADKNGKCHMDFKSKWEVINIVRLIKVN